MNAFEMLKQSLLVVPLLAPWTFRPVLGKIAPLSFLRRIAFWSLLVGRPDLLMFASNPDPIEETRRGPLYRTFSSHLTVVLLPFLIGHGDQLAYLLQVL